MQNKIENKPKDKISRADIAELLSSIGAPGKKQKEKQEAVAKLGLTNTQGVSVEETLKGYKAY